MHYFSLPDAPKTATHLRVNYFPDGGVARLRLWGVRTEDTPVPQGRPAYCPIKTGARCTVAHHKDGEDQLPSRQEFAYPELSLQELGGLGLACSNKHYGDPWNLIQSTLGRDMGDGWETARHPERPSVLVKDPNTNLVDSPLSDWCIIKLGHVASQGIQRIILDTKHFRGNYPESVQVDGCYTELDDSILEDSSAAAEEEKKQGEAPPPVEWFPLVSRCRIAPDAEHVYDHHQISNATRKVSHVRVSIYPDGGISRVRIYAAPGDLQ
jgi:allantoicase